MRAHPTWDEQQAFLAVFEGGSLSAAARELSLAQPTVRARIQALERALGTVLFTRTVTGLAPTEASEALVPHARAMALASAALVRASSAAPGEIAGSVRLSVSEFVGLEVVPRMLATLRERHPRLVVELALSDRSADLLGQEADVAVRMTEPRQDSVVARKVGTIPLGLFAHRNYLARRGVPETSSDLAGHDVIGPDRSKADLAMAERIVPTFRRETFALRTDSHPAQLAAARAGLGIAVVQVTIGSADEGLERVLTEIALPGLETWVTMHEDMRALPRVRALFDHLVDEFRSIAVRT